MKPSTSGRYEPDEEDDEVALDDRGVSALLDEASKILEHAAPGHHFEGRRGLLSALAADGFEMLADRLEAAMPPPGANAPSEVGKAYVRFALQHPERYRLMFTTGITTGECEERLSVESTRAYMALLKAVYGDGAVMLWIDGQLSATEEEFLHLVDDVLTYV